MEDAMPTMTKTETERTATMQKGVLAAREVLSDAAAAQADLERLPARGRLSAEAWAEILLTHAEHDRAVLDRLRARMATGSQLFVAARAYAHEVGEQIRQDQWREPARERGTTPPAGLYVDRAQAERDAGREGGNPFSLCGTGCLDLGGRCPG